LGGGTVGGGEYESLYGPIALEEKPADLTGMLRARQPVSAFHTKLARAYRASCSSDSS